MAIVVRVSGKHTDEQERLTLIAFDRVAEVITVVAPNTNLWDKAIAAAAQDARMKDPRIKHDDVPSDAGEHIAYHERLEVLWQQYSGRVISRTYDSVTHRHFYPWRDDGPDDPVIGSLWAAKLIPRQGDPYLKLMEELWPPL